MGEKIFIKYLKFCVVRNPYDKIVSRYYWEKSKLSFNEFVKTMNNNNNLHIHSIGEKSVCDYFIRYEHLEEDINRLCKKLKIDSHDLLLLPNHKYSQRKIKKHWSTYYDNETKKLFIINIKKNLNYLVMNLYYKFI